MSVLVKIPLSKNDYSVYVRSKIVNKIFVEEYGTVLEFEGSALIFYAYSNHRRLYIVTELDNPGIPLLKGKLPLVRESVTVIYEARSRKIDLFKYAIYNLEKEFGTIIYSFPITYWLLVASVIDCSTKKTKKEKRIRNLRLLTNKYMKRFELHENH